MTQTIKELLIFLLESLEREDFISWEENQHIAIIINKLKNI